MPLVYRLTSRRTRVTGCNCPRVNANAILLISPRPWEGWRFTWGERAAFGGSSGAAGDARVLLCKITNVDTHTLPNIYTHIHRAGGRARVKEQGTNVSRDRPRPPRFFHAARCLSVWSRSCFFLLCARLTDLIRAKQNICPRQFVSF